MNFNISLNVGIHIENVLSTFKCIPTTTVTKFNRENLISNKMCKISIVIIRKKSRSKYFC